MYVDNRIIVLYLSQRELFAFTLEMCHLQESHFILEQTELAGKLAHLVSELIS